MIRHTVAFTLKHPLGSDEETSFLEQALILAEIPSVRKFERLRQTSYKCSFRFGFSMEFEDQAGYDLYNAHPIHTAFVTDFWETQVTAFQETDYQPL